jgi:Fe-S cluster assembly scaffold protein SufB
LDKKINIASNVELNIDNFMELGSDNVEIEIGENSIVNITALNDFKSHQDIRVICEKNSILNLNFLFNYSCNLNLDLYLIGEYSQVNVKGAYILDDKNFSNINTAQTHLGKNSLSSVDIRGILLNESKVEYNGNIHIKKNASFSCAKQINKNLLLCENSHAVSIPSLEVLTDNVKCSHGSASGPIELNKLNYLMSRGLSYESSYVLLLKSFFNELNFTKNFLDEINKYLVNLYTDKNKGS